MKKVYVNKSVFTIDCDMGTQDVGWLAMAGCYEYGLNSYPVSRFVPCYATNRDGEVLHPKMVICKYDRKIGDEIYVKIKNKTSDPLEGEMSLPEREWTRQAYGRERFMMETKIKLQPANELKRDYQFSVVVNFRIHPPFMVFFPEEKETFIIPLEEIGVKGRNELYQAVIQLPMGSVDFIKIIYKDKEGIDKETMDGKNKILIEKFPDPLLFNERELMIRKKESLIKNKEVSLKNNIKHIEEQKITEEIRFKQLEEFLTSLPFSLDEIFEYTNQEIQDASQDLINIFAYLEKDEYLIFKKIIEIFNNYCKFYDETGNESIDLEGLQAFFKNFFDKKEDLSSLISDFQKFYISRMENLTEYNLLDFIFTIIYLLYNIQIYKTITIENELANLSRNHIKKLEEESYRELYQNEFVMGVITSHMDFLKNLFLQFSKKKFENYYEMGCKEYLEQFIKTLVKERKYDISVIETKFLDDLCFFDFLEKIVWMAEKVYINSEVEMELYTKVSEFIMVMEETWPDMKPLLTHSSKKK